MRAAYLSVLTTSVVVLGMSACTELSRQSQSMPTQTDGAAFFAANCASCHGADAKGGGPLAAGLAKQPRDLTLLTSQNGGTFPTAPALSYIYGDPENSHLARVMPQFGDELADDLVPVDVDGVLTPTPRELAGLLAFLESIQQ